MTDLYLILIPAILMMALLGLWIIGGMRPEHVVYARFTLVAVTLSVAGIITISYVSSIVALLMIVGSVIHYIIRRRNANKTT